MPRTRPKTVEPNHGWLDEVDEQCPVRISYNYRNWWRCQLNDGHYGQHMTHIFRGPKHKKAVKP